MSENRNRIRWSVREVLDWAYGDQAVHGARQLPVEIARTSAPLAAYSSLWEDGAPIENTRSSGYDASPDAWRVHEMVLALGRLSLDLGRDLAAARYHALEQYRGAEPPVGEMVTDNTARGATSSRTWPTDGLLGINLSVLVMLHASKGTAPAWPDKPKWRFKPGQTVWHPKRKTKIYAKGWFSHVTAEGELPGDVARDQAIYRAWWDALDTLRRRMAVATFTTFAVTTAMPAPPEKPRRGLAG